MIDFSSIAGLQEAGFTGFESIEALRNTNLSAIPEELGVYMVVTESRQPPPFLTTSPAGHFKGRDPTVLISMLEERWIPGAVVLNVGKAGGPQSNATLRSRIRRYLEFGDGKPVGHYGGRLIWQIAGLQRLKLCWKRTHNEIPRDLERALIASFRAFYGKLPFANLQS